MLPPDSASGLRSTVSRDEYDTAMSAAILLKKAAGLHTEKKKGSGAHKPGKEFVGKVSRKQLEQIARMKMQDMTAGSLEAAMRTVEGTARSMGIEIVG